jgi:hypothetical protein
VPFSPFDESSDVYLGNPSAVTAVLYLGSQKSDFK